MTIRGGGNPITAMAAMPLGEWTRRLGALPVEAYHCFMVAVPLDPTDYKRVARVPAHTGRLPSDHQSSRTRRYSMPPSSRPSRTRPFRAALKNTPSLTAAARVGFGILRSGRKKASARSNKRKGQESEQRKEKVVLRPLDKKSPIQAVSGKTRRTES